MRGGADLDFEALYQTQISSVWRYVRARVPSPTESQDLVSEVFVRAWRSRERFQPERGSSRAWLFTIAHHTVADWWRGRGRLRERVLSEPLEPESVAASGSPEGALLDKELLAELQQGLSRLSERERDALALRFSGELRAAEIGEILGMSEGAVKMMIHRAILKLKAVMVDDEAQH